MRIASTALFGPLALALSACATGAGGGHGSGPAATADLRTAEGVLVARARVSEAGDGVVVHVEAAGLPRGTYAAHIHMVGRCDPPGFDSAGAHWNPEGRQHGSRNPQGPHLGDLPNLTVGVDDRGLVRFRLAGVTLSGGARAVLDADGAAIVIHAGPDDYRTDPTGNSGARIACGVLG